MRWLSVYADSAATQFDSELDVMMTGRYVSDADGVARTPGASVPVCVLFNGSQQGLSVVGGVSLSGRTTPRTSLSYGPLQRMTLSTSINQSNPTGSGAASDSTVPAVGTTWVYSSAPVRAGHDHGEGGRSSGRHVGDVERDGHARCHAELAEHCRRHASRSRHPLGCSTARISGEALLSGGAWHLRGNAVITSGTVGASVGSGGFTADITLGNPGTSDDTVVWNLDGVVS